jgi:hypothetical protein
MGTKRSFDPKNRMLKRVSLRDIDLQDCYFKISRNQVDDELRSSIRDFGLLDPPVLVERKGTYRIVFGFNRLGILDDMGIDSVEAQVVPAIESEFFITRALLKCLRNETGPVGRIRIISILKDFGIDSDRLLLIGTRGLHVPDEFIGDDSLIARVRELPVPVKDYLDNRDIQFRIIRDVIRLPRAAVNTVSSWLAYAPLRVNIFKFIIEMLMDIQTRDGDTGFIEQIRPDEPIDRKQWDDYLYNRIREVRYPEYTAMKKGADEIARYFSARGIRIDVPPYFEGDRIDLTVTLGKRDEPESIRKKLEDADWARLKKLLDLL